MSEPTESSLNPDQPAGSIDVSGQPVKQLDPLDKKVQETLRQIVTEQEYESDQTRRSYVRKWMESEEFWKGNQHLFWHEKAFRWYAPFEYAMDIDPNKELPFYTYVTNVYQAYGLSVIA